MPGTRTLAATLFASLDGVVESPEKWSFPFWSDETQQFKVDELRLLVYPLVLGRGKRLFDEGSQASLNLVESTTFSKGVVKLVYRPADKAGRAKKTGTARPKRNTKR